MTKEKILEILRSATPANDDNQSSSSPAPQNNSPHQHHNIKISARQIKINNNRVSINLGTSFFLIILAFLIAWIFFQY